MSTNRVRFTIPIELDRDALRDMLARMALTGGFDIYGGNVRAVRAEIRRYILRYGGIDAPDRPDWTRLSAGTVELIDRVVGYVLAPSPGEKG